MNDPSPYPQNMPTLHRNVSAAFGDDPFAMDVFRWVLDHTDTADDPTLYRAEAQTSEVLRVIDFLRPILAHVGNTTHPDLTPDKQDDLLHFIATRWANWRVGSNLRGFPRLSGGNHV